jgi:radical SAM protein with 4Fe4S-binding SPASM domain
VCNVGKSSFVIDPTGEVRPCAMLPMVVGDLTKQSIREIWDTSELLRMVRSIRWRDLHECAECDLRPWCVRCHGSALSEDGDLLGPSLIACENARARKAAMSGRR